MSDEPYLKLTLKNLTETENTLFKLGFYTNETRTADVFNDFIAHITLDFAIANPDNAPYTYFDIPKKAQNVFKAILKLGDFIGADYRQDRHVRIVLHNEKMWESCGKYADPTPLLEKIWNPTQKSHSQDTPDTTKEEQERLTLLPNASNPYTSSAIPINFSSKDNLTPTKPDYNFLAEYEKLVKKTLNPTLEHTEFIDYEMTDLSLQFGKSEK